MLRARTIALPGGRSAVAVLVPATVSGEQAVAALGLRRSRGVIVLNGGTADLPAGLSTALRHTLEALAGVAVEERLAVVTGGTDAGVFALFGQALGDDASAPCIGVVPDLRAAWPGREWPTPRTADGDEPVPLEPHHTHFLLVAGAEWGVETDAMVALAGALSEGSRSLAVLAGGGTGARREVLAHVRAGREVVVLAESGRFADELTGVIAGRGGDDAQLAATGLVTVLEPDEAPSAFADLVRTRLELDGRAEKR
jgi:hypothetical protein